MIQYKEAMLGLLDKLVIFHIGNKLIDLYSSHQEDTQGMVSI